MDEVEAVGFAMWKAEADRAAPNVGKNRTIENYRYDLDPTSRAKWDQIAQAAIAALDAARGDAEPVAWMYRHPDDPFPPSIRATRHEGCDFIAMSRRGWVETPLYAHPPAPDAARGDPVARVMEWLRKDADQTEIEAGHIVKNSSGNPRKNAAEWAMLVAMKRGLADAIERGEPFNG